MTYINIVVQLDTTRRIQFNLLQSLAHNIIRLLLRGLNGLDGGAFVQIAAIFDIELAEGISQREDVLLLELRVFPVDV